MSKIKRREFLSSAAALFAAGEIVAGNNANAASITKTISVQVSPLEGLPTEIYRMGTALGGHGDILKVDAASLLLNGKRWLPAMGEFHYARYPHLLWRTELLKMKAGGLEIVSTYVFWIYHEETKGHWRWDGKRDLRRFAQLCKEVGLHLVVRCGPWCHGEVRNGGLPDWLQHSGCKLRSTDSRFLGYTRQLYGQIARQLNGLLWKQGGPVIGIQVDNEYGGPAGYLLALKAMAVELGIDVPLYNRTGWPDLSTPMPDGELIPLYGAYANGFWDRSLKPVPPGYLAGFDISPAPQAQAAAMGAPTSASLNTGAHKAEFIYPYLCCEIGGGMETSYHRRVRLEPHDVYAIALVKLASGNCLQGYYMYHGGTNPHGQLSSMEEAQASGGWNDLPQLTYDFYAPLGEYGEARPHYYLLRKLHLFQQVYGEQLAAGKTVIAPSPSGFSWSIRVNDESGFLFVNNYAVLTPHAAVGKVQFNIELPKGAITVPVLPVTVPANSTFFWEIGTDYTCTAQPLYQFEHHGKNVRFYQIIEGIPAEWQLNRAKLVLTNVYETEFHTNAIGTSTNTTVLQFSRGSRQPLFEYATADGKHQQVVLLTPEDGGALTHIIVKGRTHAVLSRFPLWQDGDNVVVDCPEGESVEIALMPALHLRVGNKPLAPPTVDGNFSSYKLPVPNVPLPSIKLVKVRNAGPARKITMGTAGVAQGPVDNDYKSAAVWRVETDWHALSLFPGQLLLEVRYIGDCARFVHGTTTLVDNFYNGRPFPLQIDPSYFGPMTGPLNLQVLPLTKDAPIYLPKDAWPQFDANDTPVAEVVETKLKATHRLYLTTHV